MDKLKKCFGVKRVVLVSDRGMITSARIDEELKPAGLKWIFALRALTRRSPPKRAAAAVALRREGHGDSSPDFPGRRLVVCRSPDLAAEQARTRETCSPRQKRRGGKPSCSA
jgi:hypothetical protein